MGMVGNWRQEQTIMVVDYYYHDFSQACPKMIYK
jgi:hypothetical protein